MTLTKPTRPPEHQHYVGSVWVHKRVVRTDSSGSAPVAPRPAAGRSSEGLLSQPLLDTGLLPRPPATSRSVSNVVSEALCLLGAQRPRVARPGGGKNGAR